ncbi:hypothetical protein L596_012031 [Steinernema carpocapsae]|uniref:C-type lectin domain-containing protein n=1 Tax=Steinernema carpocapsae TaxID=34508 RepID=A0A4U5NVS9_STECR|nr:hypothetical protein L596_012031 [Steinernema carpocapsae]
MTIYEAVKSHNTDRPGVNIGLWSKSYTSCYKNSWQWFYGTPMDYTNWKANPHECYGVGRYFTAPVKPKSGLDVSVG